MKTKQSMIRSAKVRLTGVLLSSHTKLHRRNFFGFLNHSFNTSDRLRVKEIGPGRAAAEWVVRCGGTCRFVNSDARQHDFNAMLLLNNNDFRIEEIDGSGSSINGHGLDHLVGLKYLKVLRLHGCKAVQDYDIPKLYAVKTTLEHLELSDMYLSDAGVKALKALSTLRTLFLYDLVGVRDSDVCASYLKKHLPSCAVSYPKTEEEFPKYVKDYFENKTGHDKVYKG